MVDLIANDVTTGTVKMVVSEVASENGGPGGTGTNDLEIEEAPSPFIEGTNIQYCWDSTSLNWIKTCPRLYYYHMIEGWTGKGESVHLRFGIELHKAIEDYERSKAIGLTHDDALHDTIRELMIRSFDFKSEHKLKNRDYLVRSVVWMLDHYEDDAAKTVIKADGDPAVELSFRFELDFGPGIVHGDKRYAIAGQSTIVEHNQPYVLCGHLDKVVDFNGEQYVMDHKTTTSTPGSYYFDQFSPNNQMTLYTLASQIVMDGHVRGVIIDAIQVAVNFSRPVRGFTYRTPDQIEEWVNDLAYWLALAEGYAKANYWPMNDTACDKFGGCAFRGICSKSPQVREQFLKSSFEKTRRWNPLVVR